MQNIFQKQPDEYSRNLELIPTAIEQMALFLSQSTGDSLEVCKAFVEQEISEQGSFPLVTKQMNVLRRKSNGDREKANMSVDSFFSYIKNTNSILSPNLVVYDNPDINLSCTAGYIETIKNERGIVKKKGIVAKSNGDLDTFKDCNYQEGGMKVDINSMSGAHGNAHNVFFLKTAHSSLTSTCRVLTATANLSAERFLGGNRNYKSIDLTFEDIVSTLRLTNFNQFQFIMDKYQLKYPSYEEVITLFKVSTQFYWNSKLYEKELNNFIKTLSPIQLAAISYIGDMYHLVKFNESFMRNFFDSLLEIPDNYPINSFEEASDLIKDTYEDILVLASIYCMDILNGRTIGKLKEEDEQGFITLAKHTLKIRTIIEKYSDLLLTLFFSDNFPIAIFYMPDMIRKSVVGGDTDSSMFTTKILLEWYFGKLEFGRIPDMFCHTLVYFNLQIVSNLLPMISKQMGVHDKHLYQFQMKNEYGFSLYLRTNIAKHYATDIIIREGVVYKEPELDIKGVNLVGSNIPNLIRIGIRKEISTLMKNIVLGKGINVYEILQRLANTEHVIYESISKGETVFLPRVYVNMEDNYAKPTSTVYLYYMMWREVFEETFGEITPPPCGMIKINVNLESKKKLYDWVGTLDNPIREKMSKWLSKVNKIKFGNLLVPSEVFNEKLDPLFLPIINKRKMIAEIMRPAYIILESLDIYLKNKKYSRLLLDEIPYNNQFGIIGDLVLDTNILEPVEAVEDESVDEIEEDESESSD